MELSPTQIAFNARDDGKFNKPFPEQISFFQKKLDVPTAHWDDILHGAHDRAFMVAGAAKADLLTDLHDAVGKSIAEGRSLEWFRGQFDTIVKTRGWEGWTGSDSKAGRDWRTRVIYQTNLSVSYSAGRYQQMKEPATLKLMPMWEYRHNDTVARPRPLHVSWNGIVLPHDDPWWTTHSCPNGWGCRCRIVPREADAYKGDKAPDDGYYYVKDRFGQEHEVPRGVDYGFGYQPGAAADQSLRSMVQDKLVRYPAAITRALTRDVNRYINADDTASKFAAKAMSQPALKESAFLGFVESAEKIKSVIDADVTGHVLLLPTDAVRHVMNKHAFDGNGQRPVVVADFNQIANVLNNGHLSESSVPGTFVGSLQVGSDTYRCIFEMMGKKMRALSLKTMMIKTK